MSKIKKGDKVVVLAGKDRGKSGPVERVLAKSGRVVVGGLNVYKRHVKAREGVEGGIVDLVKPVEISNLALLCPACGKATRVGFRMEGDAKTRVCKKCGKEIK